MGLELTLVQKIADYLINHHQKLATAESCTGGGLAYALTEIPGSSHWYEQGWITYSNAAKMRELSVKETLLQQFGAVSAEVAETMVQGMLTHAPVDFGISITGIAGPSGGTPTKPVGLVWFGFGKRNEAIDTVSQLFQGDRASIRKQAIQFALEGWLARFAKS